MKVGHWKLIEDGFRGEIERIGLLCNIYIKALK